MCVSGRMSRGFEFVYVPVKFPVSEIQKLSDDKPDESHENSVN